VDGGFSLLTDYFPELEHSLEVDLLQGER